MRKESVNYQCKCLFNSWIIFRSQLSKYKRNRVKGISSYIETLSDTRVVDGRKCRLRFSHLTNPALKRLESLTQLTVSASMLWTDLTDPNSMENLCLYNNLLIIPFANDIRTRIFNFYARHHHPNQPTCPQLVYFSISGLLADFKTEPLSCRLIPCDTCTSTSYDLCELNFHSKFLATYNLPILIK